MVKVVENHRYYNTWHIASGIMVVKFHKTLNLCMLSTNLLKILKHKVYIFLIIKFLNKDDKADALILCYFEKNIQICLN